jgi:hypothetical protein
MNKRELGSALTYGIALTGFGFFSDDGRAWCSGFLAQ